MNLKNCYIRFEEGFPTPSAPSRDFLIQKKNPVLMFSPTIINSKIEAPTHAVGVALAKNFEPLSRTGDIFLVHFDFDLDRQAETGI